MSIGLKTGEGKAKSKRHTAKGENGNQRGEKWASTDAFRLPLFPLTSVNKKKERNDDKKKEKKNLATTIRGYSNAPFTSIMMGFDAIVYLIFGNIWALLIIKIIIIWRLFVCWLALVCTQRMDRPKANNG